MIPSFNRLTHDAESILCWDCIKSSTLLYVFSWLNGHEGMQSGFVR
jgi:hypothetical protein